ncbi:MAG: methyltransferase domain-containing protein [Deltaproteobacteria bacterium]|nr:methyltransferase domain-containing protein [Deltaproteobacteria bacterium]
MKRETTEKMYARAAGRYDRRLEFWFGRVLRIEGWRERAVEALGPLTGRTVLDVGCGTGANLPLLVQRVGPEGRVIGVDTTPEMLELARERVRRSGWTNVDLRRGDAVTLDAVNERVDAVLSTYCLGIVSDLDATLRRISSVLEPGGRLAILDFPRTRPDSGPVRLLHPIYSALLQAWGITSAEDLDDEAQRRKWNQARKVLNEVFTDVREKPFLWGLFMLLTARR